MPLILEARQIWPGAYRDDGLQNPNPKYACVLASLTQTPSASEAAGFASAAKVNRKSSCCQRNDPLIHVTLSAVKHPSATDDIALWLENRVPASQAVVDTLTRWHSCSLLRVRRSHGVVTNYSHGSRWHTATWHPVNTLTARWQRTHNPIYHSSNPSYITVSWSTALECYQQWYGFVELFKL